MAQALSAAIPFHFLVLRSIIKRGTSRGFLHRFFSLASSASRGILGLARAHAALPRHSSLALAQRLCWLISRIAPPRRAKEERKSSRARSLRSFLMTIGFWEDGRLGASLRNIFGG